MLAGRILDDEVADADADADGLKNKTKKTKPEDASFGFLQFFPYFFLLSEFRFFAYFLNQFFQFFSN
jgi:hypothetical protein